jgi:predicted N-acetyltransferase YhbS
MTTPNPDTEMGDWSSGELDFSDASGDDFDALAHDRVPIRSMIQKDITAIIAIDRQVMGRQRGAYYERLMNQVMGTSGIRVSLVAELEGRVVGFIMVRVDYGEFGRTEPVAVMDTIGVHPDFGHHDVGSALISQLLANLAGLRIERVRTVIPWDNFDLQSFFQKQGFVPAQRLTVWFPLN